MAVVFVRGCERTLALAHWRLGLNARRGPNFGPPTRTSPTGVDYAFGFTGACAGHGTPHVLPKRP